MFSIMMYNPGSVGSRDAICASALNRQQWMGFEGAPVTSLFSVSAPFSVFGTDHGAGLHILSDRLGFENNLSINLSYAYRMDAGAGKLGIGLGVGMINTTLDADWQIPSGPNHTPASGDPSIPSGSENVITTDFSAGLFYYTDDLWFGISSTHMNEAAIAYSTAAAQPRVRHYYLTAGYNLYPANPSLLYTPVLKIHSDGVMTQFNLGTIVEYNRRIWAGVSYRFGSAITGMAGFELLNGLKIGYSHDFSTTAIGRHSGGTHEFMLRYCFDLGTDRRPQRYRSIRIL